MVSLLLSEFKKNKRSKAVYLSGLLVILYLALTVYYTVNTVGLFDNFTYLYKFSLSYMNYLILPMILLSFTTTAFSNEYRYNKIFMDDSSIKKKIIFYKMSVHFMYFVYIYVDRLYSNYSSRTF